MLNLPQAEHWSLLLHDGEETLAVVVRDADQFCVKITDTATKAETLLKSVGDILDHLSTLATPPKENTSPPIQPSQLILPMSPSAPTVKDAPSLPSDPPIVE